MSHRIQPDRRPPRLGRRCVHGTDAQIVGFRWRSVELSCVVRRQPDQNVLTHQRSSCARRQIVLTQMHAVGTGGNRNIRAIIDDEEGIVSVRAATKRFGPFQEIACLRLFVAELHDARACF